FALIWLVAFSGCNFSSSSGSFTSSTQPIGSNNPPGGAPTSSVPGTVNLVWSPSLLSSSGASDVASGYKIYYGTSSGKYTSTVSPGEIGARTSYTVTRLTSGQTYYFALRAIDASWNEGPLSTGLAYKVP